MAKPRAGSTARSAAAAAARASPAPTSSDPNLPTPTSTPRADLSSSSGAKAAVASANRTSVGSSSSASATDLPAPAASQFASVAKEVGKRLAYDDDGDYAFPTAASKVLPDLAPEGEGLPDLAPLLLELPDPDDDDASSTTVVSASAPDAATATADSTVTQVAAPADSAAAAAGADAEGPVLTEMELVLAELHGARGLTPRSKRLLAALAETASAELNYSNPTAAALRTRRAAFWRKLRVGILAATVFSVAAIDVALAFALYGARRGDALYSDVLPPT